jgi:hypothetical protein
MWSFLKVVGWGLIGSLGAFIMVFLGLLIFNSTVPRSGSNEDGAWGWGDFALLMMSPWVGFVAGTVYGVIRARIAKNRDVRPR